MRKYNREDIKREPIESIWGDFYNEYRYRYRNTISYRYEYWYDHFDEDEDDILNQEREAMDWFYDNIDIMERNAIINDILEVDNNEDDDIIGFIPLNF